MPRSSKSRRVAATRSRSRERVFDTCSHRIPGGHGGSRRTPEGFRRTRRRALKTISSLFSPLLPDDYLELINPLWSTRELRGRIERIERETENAVTIVIKPGLRVGGPQAGPIPARRRGGKRHAPLARLLADLGPRPLRRLYLHHARSSSRRAPSRPTSSSRRSRGALVRLGGVEGGFVLPDPAAGQAPLHQRRQRHHADHEHAAPPRPPRRGGRRDPHPLRAHRGRRDLRQPAARARRIGAMPMTSDSGSRAARAASSLPGSTRPARTGASARPSSRARGHDRRDPRPLERSTADPDRLHLERFQPKITGGEEGEGGEIKFVKSDTKAESDGSKPILVAGEDAGLELPFGCREGICHTCIGKLCSGQRARHAQRQGVRHRRRDDPDVHQRPGRPNRDRAIEGNL